MTDADVIAYTQTQPFFFFWRKWVWQDGGKASWKIDWTIFDTL